MYTMNEVVKEVIFPSITLWVMSVGDCVVVGGMEF
jgi:hypothetical protein